MRFPPAWLAPCLWAAMLGPACAQAASAAEARPLDRQARAWAANCFTCHGSNGLSQGGIPSIAGREVEQTLRTLIEFRTDQRPATTVMHQHTKGYTEAELRRIVGFLSTLPAQ